MRLGGGSFGCVALVAVCARSALAQTGGDGTDPCEGVTCGAGEWCMDGYCDCADGYAWNEMAETPGCEAVDSWELTWLHCPQWFAYVSTAHCADEYSCQRNATDVEGWNMCLEFLNPQWDCSTDPNAMRVLGQDCMGVGMGLEEPCTPWQAGAAPCAEGLQCVSTWNNEGAYYEEPLCYPDDMVFTQTAHDLSCEFDEACLVGFTCSPDAAGHGHCSPTFDEAGCTAADVDLLMTLGEDAEEVPPVTHGCMACMAMADTEAAMMACMGLEVQPPACDFAELMALMENAAANWDLSAIANDPVYQNCASIADALRLAESDASCGSP